VKHLTSILLAGLLTLATAAAHAAEVDTLRAADKSDGPHTRLYVGVGAGFEAGNGLRLGFSYGPYGMEVGGGATYSGETGRWNYSIGTRYIHKLYETAYAWAGAGTLGHRVRAERARLISGGAGLGINWHLGPMFRLMLDSGWHIYSDSDVENGAIQINPTFNGALVYAW
jgi:hypothetical protein